MRNTMNITKSIVNRLVESDDLGMGADGIRDEVYTIAQTIEDQIKDYNFISRDDYENLLCIAFRDVYDLPDTDDTYDKLFDSSIDTSVRSILGMSGWATNYSTGDLTTLELDEYGEDFADEDSEGLIRAYSAINESVDETFTIDELKKRAQKVLPKEDIDTHEGDLYIRKTPESEKLINNLKDKDCGLLKTFKDQIDGDIWYDIPFANWEDDFKEKTGKDLNESLNDVASGLEDYSKDGKVDVDHLQNEIRLELLNYEPLYREMLNTRRKAHAVAFEALMFVASDQNANKKVTNSQVKNFLAKQGVDYKELLAPIVSFIEEERKEAEGE